MKDSIKNLLFTSSFFFLLSCGGGNQGSEKLFTLLPPKRTGIDFSNKIDYTASFNPMTFHSFYNGGGVAVGDINNDNLPDLFFCSNQNANKLYLNLGGFRFADITATAGFLSEGIWTSGATFADVNGDGLLDLFTSISADFSVGWRGNELYINNGNLTFTERSAEYNLANLGYSTHTAFFDYDNDGDLDCYLLGNSGSSNSNYYGIRNQRTIIDPKGGNRLLRNDNGQFTNVTKEANIYGSSIGYGLGITISDINKDGWQDIYVSNDFFEKDYLYINQRNGTFKESLEKYIHEISYFSMGADIADINNDGYNEIYVTDMLPDLETRLKSKTNFENYEKYQANLKEGYYHQFLRNTLQLNLGGGYYDEKGNPECYFSEIGRLAGIHATDWSWSSLIADLDNDGWKDIYVSNGMYKDVTDQDFIQYIANDSIKKKMGSQNGMQLMDLMPSQPLANYAFQNKGDLTFINRAKDWGLDQPVFSNGSVYVDLDNDGDLDLVTNNINTPASIYKNNAADLLPENKYLKVILKGEKQNFFGVGSKVSVYYDGKLSYQEVMPTRGFESCVDLRPNFGLGKTKSIDSVVVEWPDGRISMIEDISPNRMITFDQSKSVTKKVSPIKETKTVFTKLSKNPIDFTHQENNYVDFYDSRLLFYMISTQGPHSALGDVNGDGLDDLFLTGAKKESSALFVQQSDGNFIPTNKNIFDKKIYEDEDAVFFDADSDGDQDLYVCSGGNEFSQDTLSLLDRLYINDGKGKFSISLNAIPPRFENSSCVSAGDFDGDNDMDLFVGFRLKSHQYGLPADGMILENNGKGHFTDVTTSLASGLKGIGMITDGEWFDYDKDGKIDLILCGEYMPITIFKNEGNKFSNSTLAAGLGTTSGWWNRLTIADINGDGYPDIIGGNHGLNSRFKASEDKPITLYVNDFDGNGQVEPVLCTFNGDNQYPMLLRQDLVTSIPSLKKKFINYANYAGKKIEDVFSKDQLSTSIKLEAKLLQSCIFVNDGKGKFSIQPLPIEAQFSPIFEISVDDFDKDGKNDLVVGGNFYQAKPEIGINDASYGQFLKGNGQGKFSSVPGQKSGLKLVGAVREISILKAGTQKLLIVSKNNDHTEAYVYP